MHIVRAADNLLQFFFVSIQFISLHFTQLHSNGLQFSFCYFCFHSPCSHTHKQSFNIVGINATPFKITIDKHTHTQSTNNNTRKIIAFETHFPLKWMENLKKKTNPYKPWIDPCSHFSIIKFFV